MEIEIWEHGAGYTLASGSSACAAHALGLVDHALRVRMPGGAFETAIDAQGAITLSGASEQVAAGFLAPRLRARLGLPAAPATPAPATETSRPTTGASAAQGAAA
ncbi:hypothetical protein ACK8N7_03130 [Streptomyces griseobrunneus]